MIFILHYNNENLTENECNCHEKKFRFLKNLNCTKICVYTIYSVQYANVIYEESRLPATFTEYCVQLLKVETFFTENWNNNPIAFI